MINYWLSQSKSISKDLFNPYFLSPHLYVDYTKTWKGKDNILIFSWKKKKKKEVENTSKYSGVTLNKGVEVWCQFPPRSKGSPVKLRRFNTHSAPPFSPWATDSKTASLRGADKGISPALCLVCTPTSAEKKRDRTGLCTAGKLTLTQEELQERQDLNCTACVRQIQYSHAAKSQRGLIANEDARNQVLRAQKRKTAGPVPQQDQSPSNLLSDVLQGKARVLSNCV